MGTEILPFAVGMKAFADLAAKENPDTAALNKEFRGVKGGLEGYFKDYDAPTDLKMTASLLEIFDGAIPDSLKPAYFTELRNRYNLDFHKLAEELFAKSILDDSDKLMKLFSKSPAACGKALKKDPAYRLADELITFYRSRIADKVTALNTELARLNRIYMAGQREMQPDKNSIRMPTVRYDWPMVRYADMMREMLCASTITQRLTGSWKNTFPATKNLMYQHDSSNSTIRKTTGAMRSTVRCRLLL